MDPAPGPIQRPALGHGLKNTTMTTTAITAAPDRLKQHFGESGLAEQPVTQLLAQFQLMFDELSPLMAQASTINVTDAKQLAIMKAAREVRLGIKDVRLKCDKLRKDLKADADRHSKAVQGAYNIFLSIVEPVEEHLQKCEDFAKNAEAARLAKLREDREAIIRPLGANPRNYRLEDMSAQEFDELKASLEQVDRNRRAAAEIAERERLEREAAQKAAPAAPAPAAPPPPQGAFSPNTGAMPTAMPAAPATTSAAIESSIPFDDAPAPGPRTMTDGEALRRYVASIRAIEEPVLVAPQAREIMNNLRSTLARLEEAVKAAVASNLGEAVAA